MNRLAYAWQFAEAAAHDEARVLPPVSGAVIYTPLRNDLDYGYIAEYRDMVVIALRGTQLNSRVGIRDWAQNFRVIPDQYGRHRGYAECAAEFVRPVRDYLRGCPDKPVLLTGHSQGGALAPMLADLMGPIDNMLSIVSFGAPPSGTDKYAARLDRVSITRVVCMRDIVELRRCPFDREGQRFGLRYRRGPLFASVRDHFYSSYTRGLINYCKDVQDAAGLAVMNDLLGRCTI